MSAYSEHGCAAGGTRYLSGFLELSSTEQWMAHYGEAWPFFQRSKAHFDPKYLLNPGIVEWR
jgi:FAD/FMN-containing dehydrogenase